MKLSKSLIILIVGFAFLASTMTPFQENAQAVSCGGLEPGDVFKFESVSTPIYILNPNEEMVYIYSSDIYNTWYENFSGVKEISDECAQSIPFASTTPQGINYRPGSRLVKSAVSPKIYAVLPGNKRAEITTEEIAKALYGEKRWVTTVVEIPDFLFSNLEAVEPITEIVPHDGMILKIKEFSLKRTFYVKNGKTYRVEGTLPYFIKKDVRYVSKNVFKSIPYSGETITSASIVENPIQI